MHIHVQTTTPDAVRALRTHFRAESRGQIVHDSIHRRSGWTETYLLNIGATHAAFAGVAIGGPWSGKPTIFEFYVVPEFRTRAFDLFEAFLAACPAQRFEVQSNDVLLTAMLHTYGHDIVSEKILFEDQQTTHLVMPGTVLKALTPETEIRGCLERRQGGGEWQMELDHEYVGNGGVLFHYNRPYADIYMEIREPFRQRGLGTFLVQALKAECYRLGAVPVARCDPANVASRRTLQRSGFVPFAHILLGELTPR